MALCKTIEKSIDTDQIRAEASALAANLAGQAERAAEWVGPRVTKAAGEVARAAKEAQERLEPAYEEARTRVVEDYIPRAQRAAAAAQAAAKGARDTEPLQARRGRASFLGERSCGHRDPGAQSSALIFQAALDAARARSLEPIMVVEQA